MSELVAIPLDHDQALGGVQGRQLGPLRGFAATGRMRDAFEHSDAEEAEHTALLIARVAGLLGGAPYVVTAQVDALATEPAEFGTVTVPVLRLRDMHGVFIDADPDAASAAAAAVAGDTLDVGWDSPVVIGFLQSGDLLWHHPGELAGLLG